MAGTVRAGKPRGRPQKVWTAQNDPNYQQLGHDVPLNASGNWQQRGFESQGAAKSVSKQYGLMRQPNGDWGQMTMPQFSAQMEHEGYGPKFQAGSQNEAGTPVGIGGARWMMGKNGLDFTGQASDVPFGNMPAGNPYSAATQKPYQFGQAQPPKPGGGGGKPPRMGTTPNGGMGVQGGLGRPTNFGGPSNTPSGAPRQPHSQFGQQGKGKGQPKPLGGAAGPPGVNPDYSNPAGGGGGGLGPPGTMGMPPMPKAPPNFLPNTPGYEHALGNLNDALGAAEGAYAQGRTLIPAQLGLQQARLNTDQGVATDQLKEQLAGRGVYTPKNAAGTYGGTSPAGGGVGQSLYTRNVATPYGRAAQDLGAQGANAYADLAGSYGQAQLGYNSGMFDALLNRASDAFQAQPLGASVGQYQAQPMPAPMFSFPPGGGQTRPARPPRGRGAGTRHGNKGRPGKGK